MLSSLAKQYLNSGLSVLPANVQLKFAALRQWKEYQKRLPTDDELNSWFASGQSGICIICGCISGNLEMIDFDMEGELFERWRSLINETAPDILPKLVIEKSQSGGRHVIYRCQTEICGNTKLAQRKVILPSGEEVEICGKKYNLRTD